MRIGEVSRLTGVSHRSLRYYEAQRLINAGRTNSGHRLFDLSDVERVIRIQELFASGLCSRKIREILALAVDPVANRSELRGLFEIERERLSKVIRHVAAELDNLEDVMGLFADSDAQAP